MTCLKVAVLAIVAMLTAGLTAGCGSAATLTPKPSLSPNSTAEPPQSLSFSSAVCVTAAAKGECGPYNSYTQIAGTTSSTNVGNNVWNPIPGWRQTLYATNPGNWHVTSDMPAGNTAVVAYPSIGANYGQVTDVPTPLTEYSSIYSSFKENMYATRGTSAWAMYDVWLGPDNCNPSKSNCTSSPDEVMIQHDFADNGACSYSATDVRFGGRNGVPVQDWNLCKYGSSLIWKLARNEQSGRVDILSMLTWLVHHRYLSARVGLWSIGYGWEICSTGGRNENFQVTGFSITPTRSHRASHSQSAS